MSLDKYLMMNEFFRNIRIIDWDVTGIKVGEMICIWFQYILMKKQISKFVN